MALAILAVILTLCTHFILDVNGALSTSTTNAAFKKQVEAEKTCGSPPEKYFSSSQNDVPPRLRKSNICDASSSNNSHHASYLVDGERETFWQSTSMVNRANITIDFSGPMHKYYFVNSIEIEFGEFYRPMQMKFEKSTDHGVEYQPWHYYVSQENPGTQCKEKFEEDLGQKPATVKSVICTQYPDLVALPQDQKVEWKPAFLRGKPDKPTTQLVDWMNVTNIRISFFTLNKPYDPLAVLWYHYAVREVKVMAYCDCNGHGVSCNYNQTIEDNQCACQPGTCGDKCDQCCQAYNQYPWKSGSKGPMVVDESSACQLCNCHNHSNICNYNETIATMNASLNMEGKPSGGGVCQDCQHNTEGVNCERCTPRYYRPANRSKHSPNVCEKCGCDEAGSRNETLPGFLFLECVREPGLNLLPGDCLCKNNTEGRRCDRCKPEYYNLTESNPEGCQVCLCNPSGTVNRSNICEPDDQGQCTCKLNVQGVRCDTCNDTFYGLSHNNVLGCQACLCNYGGSNGSVCNKDTSGQCPCLKNIEGRQCERPKDRAYYPDLHFIGKNTQHSPEKNSWWTTFNVTTSRPANSGLFTLLLSYQSKSPQTVMVTVTTSTEAISKSIALDNCSSTCYRNLSEFGEMSLNGVVTVNITYPGASDFVGKRVAALPKEFYQPDILREGREDFLGNCSVINNGPLSNSSAEFCKKGVFTITTGYLGKALECNCDSNGSNNLICEKYGGQCSCKPGVMGRKCDQCQPGFYNLTISGCTACNCSADDKVCDPVSGQCKCPPNTIGRMCDQCNTTFWEWNSTTGCKDCNCSLIGCTNLQCDLTTGICPCKFGVHLKKCTECKNEYKGFSDAGCSRCDCDLQGSLDPICEKKLGQCPCKNNTMGLHCNQCKSGTFYLNEPNPKGCTDCICMGITKECNSTTKNIYQRPLHSNLWYLFNEENNKTIEIEKSLKVEVGGNVSVITANISSAAQRLVWKAEDNFTQNSLVSSYNGNLSFVLHVTNLSGAVAAVNPKVVFKGSHGITIEQDFSSVSIDQVERRSVFMKETAWVYAGKSTTVSREHFMLVLAKPLSVHVTASLLSGGDGYYKTSFGGVILPDVSDSPQTIAYEVEQCQCGEEYTGLSCERCAPSHYRVNVTGDSFFGKCSRCTCNNHTLDCYASSGQCYNCEHNTTGNHCERCRDSFYGNATDATSSDCKTCPCEAPKTTTSLCTDYYGQPKCTNCSDGYEGRLCDKCQTKYFGKPHLPGGNCSLCQCNNNSDICNTTTGECMRCLDNTTGFYCERCENGTYGYAPSHNCTDCSCDLTGSNSSICNHRTGQCYCKPHVTTRNCSKCEPNSYNFTSNGCMECKCNKFGSKISQCNESGNCACKENVEGIKCDQCKKEFYGLPDAPCKACDCNETGSNSSVCHRQTGQCVCKPGVTGRQCDRCMVMHVNFSSDGCDPCPECARLNLQGTLNNTQETVVKALNETMQVKELKSLKALLDEVDDRITTIKNLTGQFDIRVKGLRVGIADIKNNTLNKTIVDLQSQLSAMTLYSSTSKQNTLKELTRVRNITNETDNALQYVRRVQQLTFNVSNQLEALKISANQMLSHATTFLKQTFDNESVRAESELNKTRSVNNTLTRIARHNATTHRSTALSLNVTVTRNERTFNEKLAEFKRIQERNDEVKRNTSQVNLLVNETLDLVAQGNMLLSTAGSLLQETSILLNTSWAEIDYGRNALKESNKVLNDVPGLNSQMTKLNTSLSPTEDRIRSANLSVNVNGTKHASNLTAEAQLRKNVLDSIADNAKRAVDAIKQYESVVKLVNQSLETSAKVNESLQEIITRLNNFTSSFSAVEQSAQECFNKSKDVLDKTLARSIDIAGLHKNVSMANETFQRATLIGRQIDMYHNILLSRSNRLIELSEPGSGARNHSIYEDVTNADSYKALVDKLAPSIWNNSKVVQDEVSRLNTSIVYINESSEHARQLMPEAFAEIARGNAALVNVTQSNAEAQLERNKTANLTTQLKTNMERLKLKLRQAKEKIAKIQHALKIHGNTTLQYTPTGRIAQKTLYNDISLDFKAERNQVIQGPLLYLAEGLADSDSSLFLSLVYNQYVSFTYELGSRPISVVNYAVPIRTGNWYRIYASRTNEKARLTVTNYLNNISRTYESSTNEIVPRSDISITSSSLFFLGSLPDGVLKNVTRRFFYGCIDNVVVNQQRVGLWNNATKVTGNRFTCSKCLDSAFTSGFDDIIPGTSFYGSSNTYLIQSMGTFDISSTSEIMFQFRTFQKTGAIINVLNRDLGYVYGIYINSSRVVFYFKNGSVLHSLVSNKTTYDNGRWYEVRVTRGLINSTLVVKDVASQEMDVSSLTLRSPLVLPKGQKLIFGGKDPQRPFEAPISSQFAGHIRNVSLSTNGSLVSRSLGNKNLTESSDQVNSCGILRYVQPPVRFIGNGYAGLHTGFSNMSKLSIKFKTLNPSGVLVYSGDAATNYYFYLALFHGNLFLINTKEPDSTTSATTSGQTLNDGAFHTVDITFLEASVQLMLDGVTVIVRLSLGVDKVAPGPVILNGTLFIGGVKSPSSIPLVNVPVIESLVGAMEYVDVNERRQNIFSGESKEVSLAGSSPERRVLPTPKPTIPPPTKPPPTCGARLPTLSLSREPDEVKFGADPMYIGFWLQRNVLDYMEHQHVITLNFRPLSPNGVLLYATDNLTSPNQFLSIELVNGRLFFQFNTGAGLVQVQSYHNNYSVGGVWYKAHFLRIDQFGGLLVPLTRDYNNKRIGDAKTSLLLNSPLFLGGVPKGTNTSMLKAVDKNGEAISFMGCMSSLEISSANETQTRKLNPRTDYDVNNTKKTNTSCYKYVQPQVSFDGSSYILLYENYTLPNLPPSLDVIIGFRTYLRSGLLWVLTNNTGRGAVTLEQYQGQIILKFISESNQTTMVWKDPLIPSEGMYNASYELCDNKFHSVRVQRGGSMVSISVDQHETKTFTLNEDFSLTGKFYVGGVPNGNRYLSHLGSSKVRLKGCVQSLTANAKLIDLIRGPVMRYKIGAGCRSPPIPVLSSPAISAL